MKSLTIPDSVTTIERSAFSYCPSLESLTIPDSIRTIEPYTFNSCCKLKLTIPASVTSIQEFALGQCYSVKIADDNKLFYNGENGEVIGRTSKRLIWFPKTYSGSYDIPSGITSIYAGAFMQSSKLESVTIPSSVTTISQDAFLGCKNLESLTIPSSVTSIAQNTFAGCKKLRSLTVPERFKREINSWNIPGECKIIYQRRNGSLNSPE